ncbi:MAG: hypothetical protein HY810_09630 [Candidatus Omnitrophica bacterium]|nr:hypothetical protein [Candidatus Omnitrophota bacterium]
MLLKQVIDVLLLKAKDFLIKSRKNFLILVFVIFLYLFIIFVFKISMKSPDKAINPETYTYLYLIEFLNGYRNYQQDFDIVDVRFGDKFLTFTLNLKIKTKSILIVKNLVMDMLLNLNNEYPELKLISIKVVKEAEDGSTIVYGKAVFSADAEEQISWSYQ